METESDTETPRRVKRKTPLSLWIALIGVMILGAVWEGVRLPDAAGRLKQLPLKGPGFAGRDLPLKEVELKVFGKADVLHRVYVAGGQKFVLTIIDGTNDRHAVHDPLYCFKGAGWTVRSREPRPVAGGQAALLRLGREERDVEALIWFSDGRERHASALRYWWQTTLRRVSLGRSGEEPILIILQPAEGSSLVWERAFAALPALRLL